jgi:hypothetical protein
MGNKVAKTKCGNFLSLTEEEIDFLLTNTHYNREEIIEWHQGFVVRFISSLFFNFNFLF